MCLAIEEANKALNEDEVPVGAVLVRNNKVIAKSHNSMKRTNNPLNHAEFLAVNKALKILDIDRLNSCTLYVTLEPCNFCFGSLILSKVSKLYFGAYDSKSGVCGSKLNLIKKGLFNYSIEVYGGLLEEECKNLLTIFFQKKRALNKFKNDYLSQY